MKKILLGVVLVAILAPLAGCIVYDRPYDDTRSYRRPYPYRSYPYRYDSPYRYRYGY